MLLSHPAFEIYDPALLLMIAGIVLGVVFGAAAQSTRFCVRNAIVNHSSDSGREMLGLVAIAIATAVALVQGLILWAGLDLSGTRFVSPDLALGPLVVGGLMFGAGMVLTRGCPARLTVLTAQGNFRAAIVLLVFGVVAMASLRGVLAAPRTAFADLTTVTASSATAPLWIGAGLVATLGAVALYVRPRLIPAFLSVIIGATIAGGWAATGLLLSDPFDPVPAQSLAFTSGMSDTVFHVMASTALSPKFTVGMIAGVLIGAFLSATLRREVQLVGFENGTQTRNYLLGAVLMGIGGVWAGGCTIGAGLTGVSTLSLAAFIGFASIIAGAFATATLRARAAEPLAVPA